MFCEVLNLSFDCGSALTAKLLSAMANGSASVDFLWDFFSCDLIWIA